MGFGSTRAEARQLVSHKAIAVNGQTVNIPSYQVSPDDIISIRHKARSQARVHSRFRACRAIRLPRMGRGGCEEDGGVFKSVPDRGELPTDIAEQLVVELYSK